MNKDNKIILNLVRSIRGVIPGIINKAYWFGSRARGEGHRYSDYDLLLVMSREISHEERDRVIDIVIDFEADNEVAFDLHYYTLEEINHSPLGRSPFIMEAMGEGVLL